MSGRKNNLRSFATIASGDMSQASLTSAVTDVQWLDDIGYQFVWTGSPVGNFQIQISADYVQDINGNVQNAGNWVPLLFTYWTGSAFVTDYNIPTSLGSPIYMDLALLSAPYVRCVYNRTSGSGTLNVTVTGKAV